MTLRLDFEFSAAHFYEQKKWTDDKNKEIFGKCYTPYGHGHNYRLQLEVDIADNDPLHSKNEISEYMQNVLKKLDHEHLNFVIPWFKNKVPTTENISLYLQDQLRIPAIYQPKRLKLFEMDSIYVELEL